MLNYEYPPLGGGGAPVSCNLAQELVKLGHSVDVVTMHYKNLPWHELLNGVNIYRIPCIRLRKDICRIYEMVSFAVMAIPFVYKLVKSKKYDINHTHFIFPTGLVSLIIKKFTGQPYIITAHGSDVPGYNPERFTKVHKFLLPLWKSIVLNSDKITTPTNSLKELILTNLKGVFPIEVIPNGICSEDYIHTQPKAKKILLVSRLFKRKGFQYFLRALQDIVLDYEINIVGDGPYREELEKQAAGLKQKVNFLGWLENNSSQLRGLYGESSIFVFPSEAENFPIVLLEAMASKDAIISSNAGGCPEVVGDSAILVEPKNAEAIKGALLRLTKDENLAMSLGQKARTRIEQEFDWKKVSAKFENLFNQRKRHQL